MGLSLALAILLIVVAAGVAYIALRPQSTPETPTARQTPADPPAPPPAPAPERARTPREGRQLSLDAAIRELDLIKPSRNRAAQDFTAPLLGGKSFRLAGHRGQVLLINFWATWCPPCLEEMPALERLWQQHKDNGFVLLAVSLDADPAPVAPFLAAHRLTFPVGPRSEVRGGESLRRACAARDVRRGPVGERGRSGTGATNLGQ